MNRPLQARTAAGIASVDVDVTAPAKATATATATATGRAAFGLAAVATVCVLALSTLSAHAHVVLPPGGAAAGSTYAAAFHVGHACHGAQTTTALSVRLPAGFALVGAQPRPGWTLVATPGAVTWTATSAQSALPGATPDDFVVTGRLTDQPGTLWFKVLQTCDLGQSDWATIPAGAEVPPPQFPAARLDVLPRGVAAVDVREAWARPTVPGQTSSGVYARLTAPAGARLVGVSTPVAAQAALHEMRMDGDVMRMRELADGLDLPPGQPVLLAAGGYHVMLTGLKQPLVVGASIPLTLRFVDRDGRQGVRELQVPVAPAPAGAPQHAH